MLTRIEIDGFKSFHSFATDLLPFQVILGPNAAGKSNFFDAIFLLSRLAEVDLQKAFQGLRGEPGEVIAVSKEGAEPQKMSFAVEVLVDSSVRDPWGVQVSLKSTRMRYELVLEQRKTPKGIDRLFVTDESATPIPDKNDNWTKSAASKEFRKAHVRRGRREPWLLTENRQGSRAFKIKQDGRSGRDRPADAAESTILSGVTSAEFPHLYALREEIRSWRLLQLNPENLRKPSPKLSPDRLSPDGGNLAAVLSRVKTDTSSSERTRGIIPDIASTLAMLVPGVSSLEVVEDDEKKEYRIQLAMRDGHSFSSRVLSDGTLRILALVTLMYDPSERGLICFEEPENGVHPFRLTQMMSTFRRLTTDVASTDPEALESLKQVLMNSHSPVVLKSLGDNDILFADAVSEVDANVDRAMIRCTRFRRVRSQHSFFENLNEDRISEHQVRQYLETAMPTEEPVA